jgi:hypothetical protein
MTQSGRSRKYVPVRLKQKIQAAAAVGVALVAGFLSSAVADSSIEEDVEIAEWTFDQEENVACFTLRQIINDGAPILVVMHDEDDHGWQFLTGENVTLDDAMIVSMGEIVEHDRTLLEIGDMPPGYRATRVAVGERWEVEKISE